MKSIGFLWKDSELTLESTINLSLMSLMLLSFPSALASFLSLISDGICATSYCSYVAHGQKGDVVL